MKDPKNPRTPGYNTDDVFKVKVKVKVIVIVKYAYMYNNRLKENLFIQHAPLGNIFFIPIGIASFHPSTVLMFQSRVLSSVCWDK